MASRREREKLQDIKFDEMYEMIKEILDKVGGSGGKETKNKEVKKTTGNAGK